MPSSLLEIKDWWLARGLDIQAGVYIHEEEMKREAEREQRDREFWMQMFGGKASSESFEEDRPTLEEAMSRSALGSR